MYWWLFRDICAVYYYQVNIFAFSRRFRDKNFAATRQNLISPPLIKPSPWISPRGRARKLNKPSGANSNLYSKSVGRAVATWRSSSLSELKIVVYILYIYMGLGITPWLTALLFDRPRSYIFILLFFIFQFILIIYIYIYIYIFLSVCHPPPFFVCGCLDCPGLLVGFVLSAFESKFLGTLGILL